METDHNFDYDLDRRSYKNVKFSGFSIYEVKSGGLSLKKIDLTFKWHHSWPQGHGQGHYQFAPPNPTTPAFNSFSQLWECLDALIDFDFKHDDDLDSRTYLNVKFSALSIYEVKSGGSHFKKSIWPSNDLDHWPQGHDRGHHWLSPSKPYNFCPKSFFPSILVFEIFTWWF